MAKRGRKGRHTEIGNKFEAIVTGRYATLNDYYEDLGEFLGGTKPATIAAKISDFMNGRSGFPDRYVIGTEYLLGIRMADLLSEEKVSYSSKPGLAEVGTQGDYQAFERLAQEDDGAVIATYDEWGESIFDYVYRAKNKEGLRFLFEHGYYEVYSPGYFSAKSYGSLDKGEHALQILDIVKDDPGLAKSVFTKLFDCRSATRAANSGIGVISDERVLRFILDNRTLLTIVCETDDLVPESVLNGPTRVLPEGADEYLGICASNWLTPLLCYSLAHEDEYTNQAFQLIDASLRIARKTVTQIGKFITSLGGSKGSVCTDHGYVKLGHHHIIGVIGEPETKGIIHNEQLSKAVEELTSVIGSFRALAKIQKPMVVNGKIHLPRMDFNPIYKEFVKKAKSNPYLLQESKDNGRDSHNFVFDMPKGKEAGNELSLKQWRQVGMALRSIHQIPTGHEELVYCHGRFVYPDFYIDQEENVEKIWAYGNVYLGKPEDDVFCVALLAFKNGYYRTETNQESLEAFLEGYGYPLNGFYEAFCDGLIAKAKKEKDNNEARFLMDSALAVMQVIKAKKES